MACVFKKFEGESAFHFAFSISMCIAHVYMHSHSVCVAYVMYSLLWLRTPFVSIKSANDCLRNFVIKIFDTLSVIVSNAFATAARRAYMTCAFSQSLIPYSDGVYGFDRKLYTLYVLYRMEYIFTVVQWNHLNESTIERLLDTVHKQTVASIKLFIQHDFSHIVHRHPDTISV